MARQSLNKSNDSYKIRKDIESYLDINSSLFTQNLCTYFNEKYNHFFYPMRYNSIETDKWKCTKSCPIDIWEICNQFEKKITNEKVPLAIKKNNTYYIIFPFISDLTDNYLKDIIILKSKDKIPKYILDNLRHIINYYFAVYLRDKKQEILDLLTNKTKDLNEKIKNILDTKGNFNIDDLLSEDWLKNIFKNITLISNAHSISLRLYYSYNKLLKRVCEYSDNHIEGNNLNTILYIKDHYYNKSQVVRAFVDKKTYHTKIINTRNKNKFYILRENTKSILSIPIHNDKKTIGVLNFESLIENGLNIEKEYFKEFANYLSYFIQQIYTVNDIYWLTKRGNVYQNYHELENILKTDKELSPKLKNKIKELVEMLPISGNLNKSSLNVLKKLRDDFLLSKKNDLKRTLPKFEIDNTYIKYEMGCRYNIANSVSRSIYLSESCVDSLKVIYKNLLDNYNKYSDKDIDTLAVNLVSDKNNHKVLNFIISTHNLYSFDKEWIFKSPYYSKHNHRYHYGLFIAGRLTQHLGGYIDIVFNTKKNKTTVKINIPIEEKS